MYIRREERERWEMGDGRWEEGGEGGREREGEGGEGEREGGRGRGREREGGRERKREGHQYLVRAEVEYGCYGRHHLLSPVRVRAHKVEDDVL